MVLLIIIPKINGYFIGNIPNIFRQTHIYIYIVQLWPPYLGPLSLGGVLSLLPAARVSAAADF